MTLAKAVEAVDEWAEVAQNAVREGAALDVSSNYETALSIDVAISNATPHTGTKIAVQISSNGSGNEDWTTLVEFIGPTGTADLEALSGSEAIGQTVLEVASTTGYEADESRWVFLEDVGAVADSEMLLQVSHVANTSITVQDGLTVAKDSSDQLSNIAQNYVINIPFAASRVRVIYDNTYDSDGATVHTKCRASKVTGL